MEGAELVLSEVEIEIFGAKYTLKPNHLTIALFERERGKSVLTPEFWVNPPQADASAILIWAALGGPKSGKTVEDVGNEMDLALMGKAYELAGLIFQHYTRNEPKKDVAA